MDREQLRAIQRPFKERYRAEPGAAMLTLRASGTLGEEEISCSVRTGQELVAAGLHPATGGDGSLACSGDLLLQALVACAGVTLKSVATARGIEVSGTVTAVGELDLRGTLGLDRDVPVGFRRVRLMFHLDTSAEPGEVAGLLETAERYCVVFQTLAAGIDITMGLAGEGNDL